MTQQLAETTVTSPNAIPGFPEARQFVLHDLDEQGTFQLLDIIAQSPT